MAKVYEYEVYSNSTNEVVAKIWWDGRKIDSDSKRLLTSIKGYNINGKTVSDGVDFFNSLPSHFKNGYLVLRRTK